MQPSPETTNPAGGRGSAKQQMTGQVGSHSTPRRCPWHAEVIRLAAEPIAAYSAWRDCALIFAGSGAWNRASEARKAGRRAVTVCPPGMDPAAIQWPAVRFWIGDTGDLPTADAIALARCLIDHGAELVQVVGERIRPSLTMRRAR